LENNKRKIANQSFFISCSEYDPEKIKMSKSGMVMLEIPFSKEFWTRERKSF